VGSLIQRTDNVEKCNGDMMGTDDTLVFDLAQVCGSNASSWAASCHRTCVFEIIIQETKKSIEMEMQAQSYILNEV
jgi:hypothetical protein